jgi:hypothetical protein
VSWQLPVATTTYLAFFPTFLGSLHFNCLFPSPWRRTFSTWSVITAYSAISPDFMQLESRLDTMHPFQAALLTWLSIPFVLSASDTYETIRSLDAYKSQRACGQACFYVLGAGAEPFDALGITLGCTQPVLDSCFCRTDVQGAGETYLSTCISSRCTGPGDVTNDIDMATSIYDSYC